MNNPRKICFITGTRAEFGLLSRLMALVDADPRCHLQVVATNMHLDQRYGMTVGDIEAAGFRVDARVPMPRSTDSPEATLSSMATEMEGMSRALSSLRPDLIVMLGDRYEMLVAATAALMLGIPIAHIHGGETSEGAIDETIRHCLTKMSHLHFTSTEPYRRRVIQLGEAPERVFYVGALGVENIKEIPLIPKDELEAELGVTFTPATLICTYHPATLAAGGGVEPLIGALDMVAEARFIFTLPNSDPGADAIRTAITRWCEANPTRGLCFASLGIRRYLSAMHYSAGVIGNSSSGIIEAPSTGVPTLDIGDRQRGRTHAESVIHVADNSAEEIAAGIRRLLSPEIRQMARCVANPYDKPGTARAIVETIATYPLEGLLQKKFHDLPQDF